MIVRRRAEIFGKWKWRESKGLAKERLDFEDERSLASDGCSGNENRE